jgi:xylulokinase
VSAEPDGTNRGGAGADEPAVIGVDIGTGSIKAVAFDPAGRKLAAASRPTPTRRMPTGGEYDPDTIFDTALAVLAEVARGLAGRPVAGIAATSMGESCVLIDAEGRAVAPTIAWFDRRTVQEAAFVENAIGADRVFAVTGAGVEFNFTLVKLLWMRRNWPEAFARARRVLMMADWIAFRLSGVAATDPTLAGRTQYYDNHANAWSEEMLALIDRGIDFPAPVKVGGAALGPVAADVLAATGLAGTPIVGVGGHDHIVGAMACGLYRPGTLIDSMGTAEALILGSTRPVSDFATIRRGYLQAPVEPGRMYWVGGSVFTSGGAMEWARALTGGADQATLIAEAKAVSPGSGGVVFVPHVGNGVSPPNPDPNARGAFLGLTVETTRGALYRSVLEGLAMQSRMILDDMARLPGVTPPTGSPRLTGGGSRNPVFMEIKANVFGRPVTIVDEPESTALGAALLGGVAAGLYADVETAVSGLDRREYTVEPDPAVAARYDALRETVFEPASAALKPVENALAAWRGD